MENYEDTISEEIAEEISAPAAEETSAHIQTPAAEEPVADTPVQKPQKPSPFADSPYEMPHQATSAAPAAAPAQPKAKKPAGNVAKTIFAFALVFALVATGCGITAYSVNSYWQQRSAMTEDALDRLNDRMEELQEQIKDNSYTGNGNSVSGTDNVNPSGLTPGQLYAQCVDSVVAITATVQSGAETGYSSGSGFVISADGYIVSNAHVVAGATGVTVTVHGGEEYDAQVIGYDENNDIALLRAVAPNLKPVTIGSSDALIVGDQVVAIGNPLGELTSTLTVGYISGKGRDITTDGTVINMLQTDAAINPGNSGGPLFNMKGEVIGITTAKYSGSTASGASIEGIGFAIPMDDVLDKIEQLKTKGYVSTPYMGISVDNRNAGIGAYVVKVDKGGAAEKAGMLPGDIIIQLGETPVSDLNDVSRALRDFVVGDTTTVTVYRNRKVVELTITFGEKPQQNIQSPTEETTPPETTDIPGFSDYFDWWEHFFGGN